MPKTQKIKTETYIKFGLLDKIKVLLGMPVLLTVKTEILQEEPINSYNAYCEVSFLNPRKIIFKQDKPYFGDIIESKGGTR